MVGNVPQCAVSWSSKKQLLVTLSTTEAEFIAVASCICQKCLAKENLGTAWPSSTKSPQLYIMITFHSFNCLKILCFMVGENINMSFQFLRDFNKDEVLELIHCSSQEQISDIMTKPLKLESFFRL